MADEGGGSLRGDVSTVLDEADRILDMGFEKDVNAILRNIPRTRQTLLFSATLSKNVRHLARLSLQVRPVLLTRPPVSRRGSSCYHG